MSHKKQSPTVTSIEKYVPQRLSYDSKKYPPKASMNNSLDSRKRRIKENNNISSLIERSISATSSLINKSQQQIKSRSISKQGQHYKGCSQKSSGSRARKRVVTAEKEGREINITNINKCSTTGNSKGKFSGLHSR